MNGHDFIKNFQNFPPEIQQEIIDFAFYIEQKREKNLIKSMQTLAEESKCFEFLNNEEDLYSLADAKELYK